MTLTTNALAVIGTSEWQVLQQQADALVKSGFLPQAVNTPQKAVAIMMLGRELGIQAWAALTTINVIQGKPTVSPQLMLALINRSGQLDDMQIEVHEDDSISVMMKRKGRSEHYESFGRSDAEKMGLWGKDNWRKQPVTMMKWRAVAACARVVFADVILGLYTPEEMGADVEADEQGNMTVTVKPEAVPPAPAPAPAPQIEAPAQSVSEEQPSASVHGAGLTKPTLNPVQTPAQPEKPAPADPPFKPTNKTPDEPLPIPCDALIITKQRQYILVSASKKQRIPVTPDQLRGTNISGLDAWKDGTFPILPSVSVLAYADPDGWRVESVTQAVPAAGDDAFAQI